MEHTKQPEYSTDYNHYDYRIIKIVGILFVAALFLFSGCSSSKKESATKSAAKPVRIAALFPLTGGLASYGESAANAAQIAVDEINAAGGIHGRKLIIEYQDHECNPKTAVSIFEQLTEAKGIQFFTSAACSGTVLAIAPKLEAKGALLLGTIITTPKITGVSPYVFRNWASDLTEAKLFADEIKKRGYRKVGVIHEETDYATGLKIGLEQYLQDSDDSGVPSVPITTITIISESFPSGSADVRSQLAKLQAAKVDMLFISPQTVISADIILKQMGDLQFHPKALFVNDNIIKATDIVSRYKETLEGAVSGDYVLPQAPAFQQLMKKYKEKHGAECPQANICAGVYDAVKLLTKAIAERGEDVNAVQQYLKTAIYPGVSGEIRFDENNDRDGARYSLFVIKDGKAIPYNNE